MSKIQLVDNGRISFAKGFINEDLRLAWGEGDPAWDVGEIPDPIGTDDALEVELGRREVTQAGYVVPEGEGDIDFDGVMYSLSAEPTRRVYVRTAFLKTEEPTADIREVGLFMGTETASANAYITPDQITDPGLLVVLYRFAKIERSADRREIFEFIITV